MCTCLGNRASKQPRRAFGALALSINQPRTQPTIVHDLATWAVPEALVAAPETEKLTRWLGHLASKWITTMLIYSLFISFPKLVLERTGTKDICNNCIVGTSIVLGIDKYTRFYSICARNTTMTREKSGTISCLGLGPHQINVLSG